MARGPQTLGGHLWAKLWRSRGFALKVELTRPTRSLHDRISRSSEQLRVPRAESGREHQRSEWAQELSACARGSGSADGKRKPSPPARQGHQQLNCC
jgi:hypothetical protein